MHFKRTSPVVKLIFSLLLWGLLQCSNGNEKEIPKGDPNRPSADTSAKDSNAKIKDNHVKISSSHHQHQQRTLNHQLHDERKNTGKENMHQQHGFNAVASQQHRTDTHSKDENVGTGTIKHESKTFETVSDVVTRDKPNPSKSSVVDNANSNSEDENTVTVKDDSKTFESASDVKTRDQSNPSKSSESTLDDNNGKSETSHQQSNKKAAESIVTQLEHEEIDNPTVKSNVKESSVANQLKSLQEELLAEDVASPLPPPLRELTDEEKAAREKEEKSNVLYHEGIKLINSSASRASVAKGYLLLSEAKDMGHEDAEVEIGFAHLMGAYLPLQITKAREIFEKHAASGNPRAQAGLGVLYATGIGTNSSQAKALVYLTFSALGNDVMGRMILGYRYLSGIGVAKSCETALNYYKTVADQVAENVKVSGGSILMRVRLLDEVERPGSSYGMVDEDLVQYYQFLADKGDIPAQVTLGQLNYQGSQGFEQNHAKAFEYFSKAAEAGNANALGYLGKIYSEGTETVKQSNATALRYFKEAAEKGNPIGHAGLGLMYLYGKGVEKDTEKAFKHFQSSADQGWPEGQMHLGNMYFNGLGVKRDFKQALRCFNLAAQNGHLLALYYLARMHATGNGVPRNCQTATELYKNVCERGRWSSLFELAYKQHKASRIDSSLAIYMLLAELGYEVAQSNAAFILDQEQSGLFPNQTYARALMHWDRAAEQGYSTARLKLGDYHYYGKGTEVDYEIAASHYKIAVEQSNNAQAMFNIGYMHEQGLGMKRDIHLAKRHYDMAADASTDAVAPVTLALVKLAFLFAFEFLESKQWFHSSQWRSLSHYLSDDWDLYLMTLLALVLGFVVAYRRQRR